MDKVPYEVLDHFITDAIQARDEVITRNKENQINIMYVLHFRSKKNDMLNTFVSHPIFISGFYIIRSFLLLIKTFMSQNGYHFIIDIEDAIMVD